MQGKTLGTEPFKLMFWDLKYVHNEYLRSYCCVLKLCAFVYNNNKYLYFFCWRLLLSRGNARHAHVILSVLILKVAITQIFAITLNFLLCVYMRSLSLNDHFGHD